MLTNLSENIALDPRCGCPSNLERESLRMRKEGSEEHLEGERSHRGARPPTSPLGKSSTPKSPRRNELSHVFAQDLIVFCPQVGGGVGGWDPLLPSDGGRGYLWTGHLGGVLRGCVSELGTEILLYVLILTGFH